MNWAIEKKMIVGFTMAFIVVAGIGLLSYQNARRIVEANQWVVHTHEVLEKLGEALRKLQDVETGARGYIITGKTSYLEPYHAARNAVDQTLGEMKQLISDNPTQQRRIEQLERLVAVKLEMVDKMIALRREAGFEAAREMVLTDQGKRLMDEIRQLVKDIGSEEKTLLQSRHEASEQSKWDALLAFVALILVDLAFLSRIYYLIRGEMIERERREREVRQWAEQVQAAHSRLDAILVSMGEGLYQMDNEGKLVYLNPIGEQILGYRLDEIQGANVHELIHSRLPDGTDRPTERCPLVEVVKTGTPHRCSEDYFIRKDGSFLPVAYSSTPLLMNGQVHGAVLSFHDITERKEAEEKLKTFSEKLARSNRELQDFAHVASHDLQEPLRKVQAFGDRLKAKCGDLLTDDARDYLERMMNASKRMQTLINDLLTFSRVTTKAQPFVSVELDKITREVLSDLEVRIDQTSGRVEVDPLPNIEADPTQMRQLMQNLIGNALKFHRPETPPVIRVHAEIEETGGDQKGESKICRLTIEDNGIGFDEKYLDRIFTVFQRLHGRNEYEGSGVGLAVCRKIAERHHGRITAKSRPGEGATFIVTLPLTQPKGELSHA